MRFQRLEEASPLEIDYNGCPLDLHAFGVFHLNLQDMLDKVAFFDLSQAGILEPSWRRPRHLPYRYPTSHRRFVRAEPKEIRAGSLEELVVFGVAAAMADPNTIAILNNLSASTIWAIGLSGIRNVRHRWSALDGPPDIPPMRKDDPFDLGPNLREVMLALAESNSGSDPATLKFRAHKTAKTRTLEVTIEIPGNH